MKTAEKPCYKTYIDMVKLTILQSVKYDESSLTLLHGMDLVLEKIFQQVSREYLPKHVDTTSIATMSMSIIDRGSWPHQQLKLPSPRDININMMPIKYFDAKTIPDNCKGYIPYIRSCLVACHPPEYYDKIVYLTIQEGWVPIGKTQRRPGLHIERPACVDWKVVSPPPVFEYGSEHHNLCWGLGYYGYNDSIPVDGIYMATNLANTSRVWPTLITNPEEVTDNHGGIEHLRDFIGKGQDLEAHRLQWITDRTPHESLPVTALHDDPEATQVYRQFFRLVVGKISVWYKKHNTPNPLGVEPDAPISDIDKFI